MFVDFVLNGMPHGLAAERLHHMRWDPGLLRPYYDDRGRPCCTVNTGRTVFDDKLRRYRPVFEQVLIKDLRENGIDSPVFNSTTLTKEQWIQLDTQIQLAARPRLRAWADLAAANSYGGFNAMAKMILEHQTASDPGFARVDMDGLTEGRNDAPLFGLEGLPLPITHADFYVSMRLLAASRNGMMPFDTQMGEACGRRVAESVERTTIGVEAGIAYGGNSTQVGGYVRQSAVYGYTNFPARLTYTGLRAPTIGHPEYLVTDLLAMRDALFANNFYGPFMAYFTNDWDQYLDQDYYIAGVAGPGGRTLRERVTAIEGIAGVRRLDYWTGMNAGLTAKLPYQILLVQMTGDVARAINGMQVTTVQWEEKGGMKICFKVMAILVPQLRSDFYGHCGICHGTTS